MKKLLLLFSIVTTLIAFSLTSCDNSENIVSESVQTQADDNLSQLFVSIDSLNNEYATSDTVRGNFLEKWSLRILCGMFDASAGAVAVGLTGWTGPLGAGVSLGVGVVASGLYEDYFNYIREFGII